MCLRYCAQVLKDKFSVLHEWDSLSFQPSWQSFQTDIISFQTDPIRYTYFHVIYKALRRQVFSNRDSKFVWNEDSNNLLSAFSGVLKLSVDKTASSLSILSFISYHIYTLFLHVIPSKRAFLIENGYPNIEFLPVSVFKHDFNDEDLFYYMKATYIEENAVYFTVDDAAKMA